MCTGYIFFEIKTKIEIPNANLAGGETINK